MYPSNRGFIKSIIETNIGSYTLRGISAYHCDIFISLSFSFTFLQHTKRKLDEVSRKLEGLYDRLREQKIMIIKPPSCIV